jgi:plasmid maintenance system antidote protein VapI
MSVKAMLAAAQNHAFAEFVKNRMQEVGITTATQLATECGIKATNSLRALLRGETRAAPKTIARLAKALGVEVDVLKRIQTTPPRNMIEGPPARRELVAVPQVTLPKPPAFSMTSTPAGMHIKLDAIVPYDQAFKLLDVLRAVGMFHEGA